MSEKERSARAREELVRLLNSPTADFQITVTYCDSQSERGTVPHIEAECASLFEKTPEEIAHSCRRRHIISETTKRALEHYGHDLDELETQDPEIGTWPKESAMERIKSLPDFMDFVDDTKKVRITFEYDPDYPIALLLVEAEMKPIQWVPYTSEGETREADHSDV